jgi:hypothetical protein
LLTDKVHIFDMHDAQPEVQQMHVCAPMGSPQLPKKL